MTGPRRQGETNRKNREQGKKGESDFASATGMKIQLASGCGKIEVEDLTDKDNLGQVKTSRGKSVAIKVVDIECLIQHARDADGKKPVMFVGFETLDLIMMPRRWALIPLEEWKEKCQ